MADAIDDQRIALFADRTPIMGDQVEEARITQRTLDCVLLIGGLDDAIDEDASAEMIGVLRTDCRCNVQERLTVTPRSPMGIIWPI